MFLRHRYLFILLKFRKFIIIYYREGCVSEET